MNARESPMISYFTLIGWIIAYAGFRKHPRNSFLQYHLRQSLGLVEWAVIYQLLVSVVLLVSDELGFFMLWGNILYLVFMGLGMINALNDTMRPIPVIGKYFEDKFPFIK